MKMEDFEQQCRVKQQCQTVSVANWGPADWDKMVEKELSSRDWAAGPAGWLWGVTDPSRNDGVLLFGTHANTPISTLAMSEPNYLKALSRALSDPDGGLAAPVLLALIEKWFRVLGLAGRWP